MNPVAFTLFGHDVRWYGILIGTGMLLGIFIAYKRAPRFDIIPEKVEMINNRRSPIVDREIEEYLSEKVG